MLVAFQLLLLRQISAESESEPESAVIGELGFGAAGNLSPTQETFSGSNFRSSFGAALNQRNPFQFTNSQAQAFQNPQVRFPADNQRFRNPPVFSQPIFPTQSSFRTSNENFVRPSTQSFQNQRGQLNREELLRYRL